MTTSACSTGTRRRRRGGRRGARTARRTPGRSRRCPRAARTQRGPSGPVDVVALGGEPDRGQSAGERHRRAGGSTSRPARPAAPARTPPRSGPARPARWTAHCPRACRAGPSGTARHRGLDDRRRRRAARTRSWSSRYLRIVPRVASTAARRACASPSAASACGPVDRLGDARRLVQLEAAQHLDRRRDLAGERVAAPPAPSAARSRARARSRGARSSGRGSGA